MGVSGPHAGAGIGEDTIIAGRNFDAAVKGGRIRNRAARSSN